MRILALGDSLGLPRPYKIKEYAPIEQQLAVPYSNVHSSILHRALINQFGQNQVVEVINRARRFTTIKDVYNEFWDHLFYFEPNILILQVGIVDCWLRDYLENQQLVRFELFEIYLKAILKLLSFRKNCTLILVGICPSSKKMYQRYQGMENEIQKYNIALKKATEQQHVFYIDMEKNISPNNPHQYLLLDDIHLNTLGNELVAKECFEIIKNINHRNTITDSSSEIILGNLMYLLEISKHKKLFIFGASEAGKKVKQLCEIYHIGLEGFIDNSKDKVGTDVENLTIYNLDYLIGEIINQRVFIIVASMHWENIVIQLLEHGLTFQQDFVISFNQGSTIFFV